MLLAWLLYSVLAYNGCLRECCTAEGEGEGIVKTPVEDTVASVVRFPIDFKWSDATAFTNDGFDNMKQQLLAQMSDSNILEITGFYFEDEPKPDGYDNMGFARADQIKQLFSKDIPEDQIRLRARLVDEKDGVRTGYFESGDISWVEAEQETETVEELDDRIIIRFPFNSTRKDYDPSVDEYLDKLAERIKQTSERVRLTGHTDNVGGDEANVALGRARAREIRDILTSKGVNANQITIDSKGESQPVASNDTEAGRHDNRRVEVRLIKNN